MPVFVRCLLLLSPFVSGPFVSGLFVSGLFVSGLFISSLFVSSLFAPAASAAAADPLEAIQAELRPEFAALAGTRTVPGLGIALVVDGRTRWIESFGFADRAARRVLTNETRHALGDLSKPFVAALAVRLAAEGRVDLAAPAARYLPQLVLPVAIRRRRR